MRAVIRQISSHRWGWLLLYAAVAAGMGGLYLGLSAAGAGPGFPLDDGWIHQTYARNLASSGRWEYIPGQVSAGSTAPFWSVLLAVGYRLGFPFMAWTMGLGVAGLALSAWAAHIVAEVIFPDERWVGPAAGLLCVTEWHLVWAAMSGMETVVFIALALGLTSVTVRALACDGRPWLGRFLVMGTLAGLLVLTRPEGVILIGVLGMWGVVRIARRELSWRAGLVGAATALAPFLLLLIPYLFFNWRLSGRIWPNTFYAKQTEYAVQLAWPIWTRAWRVIVPPLTGPQVLLVPGLILGAAAVVRRGQAGIRQAPMGAMTAWLPAVYGALHLAVYALRLPVTYQHGRYLTPAIPFLIIGGLGGLLPRLRLRHPAMAVRLASRAWVAAGVALVPAFAVIGAQAYQKDVEVIDSEMVSVARWLAGNTEPDDLVAAHDIGAIGYYAERPILDLAGLISPEVIPMLGDPAALSKYVLASGARYLVTAPGWPYERLTERADVSLVFRAESRWTVAEGLNTSSVYLLPVSDR
jgi:hypothetical protein